MPALRDHVQAYVERPAEKRLQRAAAARGASVPQRVPHCLRGYVAGRTETTAAIDDPAQPGRRRRMRAAHPEQQQRLYTKLCRELGPSTLAALSDADVTEVMCNPDGSLWVESHAQGMREIGDHLTESQVESLIGTVAALLGTVVHSRAPIVEGELPINGYRFEGILPPVSTARTFVIRKRASQIYGLEDYVKAGILTVAHQKALLDGVRDRQNILIAGGTASGKTTLANALML